MDISEVAKSSGVPASTLRYYEERGLIRSNGRHGLRRTFDSSVLEQLVLIALGRAAEFSLEEIKEMFAPDGRLQVNRQLVDQKAKELDKTIQKLTSLRDELRHVAICPAHNHLECPKFRRLMGVASTATKNNKSRKSSKKKSFRDCY